MRNVTQTEIKELKIKRIEILPIKLLSRDDKIK